MPNRILKETICTSDNLDHLSMGAEVFFYRLLVRCDDFGRMDARCSILRAACFPLRLDGITDEQMAGWLKELVSAGLLWIYAVDNHSYLQITKWDKHQQKRAKFSKYPQPPDDASACNQLISDASNSLREARDERRETGDEKREDFGADAPTQPTPKSSKSKSDPRTATPAIQAIHALTNKYPQIEMYDKIIASLGESPDITKLRECREAWLSRGYNPNALTWALEWYPNGGPPKAPGKHDGKPDEPAGFKAIREAMNDPRWNGK